MDVKELMSWAEEAATHQKIVGDYEGAYSLGVTDNPLAFLLRVEPDEISRFPTTVNLHGVDVPVVVHGNFVPPEPLGRRR
ncbi:MAG TPA: hypothetical protein VMG10_08950 [Gemmataceae bacterium]|nr:hypothetical protein [Gemmataceae bacterium]